MEDNPALSQAIAHADQVIPVFVLDPGLLNSPYVGKKRLAFLLDGLQALDRTLRSRKSRLIVRQGKPLETLKQLIHESNASTIFAAPDYSPYARRRDEKISQEIRVIWTGSPSMKPPGTILPTNGRPYRTFSHFNKAWRNAIHHNLEINLATPANISTPETIKGLSFNETGSLMGIDPGKEFVSSKAGESQAQKLLEAFIKDREAGIYKYDLIRNRIDSDNTSHLSPYLKFGMLSPERVIHAALRAIHEASEPGHLKSAEAWLDELIWREFYIHILYHFPEVRRKNFRLGSIDWENDEQKFLSWREGKSGYPIVDAAMRQLRQTGWIHNRARMIVASFLTKDLLIDWRWGERWFMKQLIDGDPAANNGGWQWVAGTGTDAAPYFRIFNPVTQGKKHDPNGSYVRRWIPELEKVPNHWVHTPWEMNPSEQKDYQCEIGVDYPYPIVNHEWARTRALDIFKQARK